MWDRTGSEPPGRCLTCCPSPKRSQSRSQLEISSSSSNGWRSRSASRSSPLVNSPGQSRRSRGGRPAHFKPRRRREEESRRNPGLGSPARREGIAELTRGQLFRPHLGWRRPWLERVHKRNLILRYHRGTQLRELPQRNEPLGNLLVKEQSFCHSGFTVWPLFHYSNLPFSPTLLPSSTTNEYFF